MKNKIYHCCDECGVEANRLTCLEKHRREPKQKKFLVSTYHFGKCDICKKERSITEVRDFYYPNFNLLKL